jgi:hypothetical protein
MGVGWPGITPGQLHDMMLDPQKQVERRKHRLVAEPSTDGYGCCPICHEFVYAQFTQPGDLASCPRCGGLIDALDPLGTPSV